MKLYKYLVDYLKKSNLKKGVKQLYYTGEVLETLNPKSNSNKITPPKIIKSTTSGYKLGNSFIFRNQTYTIIIAKLNLSKDINIKDIYTNIEYGVSLIDRVQYLKQVLNILISKIVTSLRVRGVKVSYYEIAKYIT